jgi:hypothetical protein
MEQFISNILNGKHSKDSVVDQLFKKPPPEKNGDMPNIPRMNKNYAHQLDILYLPNDGGKKYCLVCVDQGSRYIGAVALEDRKAIDVINGLKEIYKTSKYVKKPKVVITDQGSEFKGNFDDELKKMKINNHKLVKVGRHRSVSLAERKNQTIGKIIHKILTQVQLTSKNVSSKWVEFLPLIIKSINEKVTEQNKKIKEKSIDEIEPFTYNKKHKIDMLMEGDKVRVALDNPIDVDGKALNGAFRSGDIRYDKTIRTVKYMYMKPEQPIMYFLNGSSDNLEIELVGYTRNQLLKVSNNENQNEKPLFENESDRHEVQNIKSRIIDDEGRYHYLVKFKGIRKADWHTRKDLEKELGKSYMNNLDKSFDKLPTQNV